MTDEEVEIYRVTQDIKSLNKNYKKYKGAVLLEKLVDTYLVYVSLAVTIILSITFALSLFTANHSISIILLILLVLFVVITFLLAAYILKISDYFRALECASWQRVEYYLHILRSSGKPFTEHFKTED